MAVKKTQVTVYMSTRNQGKPQVKAAARAGISERTGRRIDTRQHSQGSLSGCLGGRADAYA